MARNIGRFADEPGANLESGPLETYSRIQSQIAVVDVKGPERPVKVSFLQPAKRPEVVHQRESDESGTAKTALRRRYWRMT